MLHYQEWGTGDPLIALAPLALESTAFAGMARVLSEQGVRTIAADLPGFGRTPAPDAPLTPARMAAPVVELARSLEKPPILLGMSLGGRVALEACLRRPRAFRGVVLIAPYLPWRRYRWLLPVARFLDPAWGEYLPLERIWPVLERVAHTLEARPRGPRGTADPGVRLQGDRDPLVAHGAFETLDRFGALRRPAGLAELLESPDARRQLLPARARSLTATQRPAVTPEVLVGRLLHAARGVDRYEQVASLGVVGIRNRHAVADPPGTLHPGQ